MIKVCEEASIQVLLYNELQKYFKWKEWQNAKYVRYVRNIIYTEIHIFQRSRIHKYWHLKYVDK